MENKFIELTLEKAGGKVLVNVRTIESVNGNYVSFSNSAITVVETYHEIKKLINGK